MQIMIEKSKFQRRVNERRVSSHSNDMKHVIARCSPGTKSIVTKIYEEYVKTLSAHTHYVGERKSKFITHVSQHVKQDQISDIEWVASHQQELTKYYSKYVAISKGRILGAGNTAGEAFRQAKKEDPQCDPLIMLVSSSDIPIVT